MRARHLLKICQSTLSDRMHKPDSPEGDGGSSGELDGHNGGQLEEVRVADLRHVGLDALHLLHRPLQASVRAYTHYDQDMRRLEHVSVVRPDDQVATIPNLSPCEISGSKRIEPASSGPTSHVFRTIPQLHLSDPSASLTGSTARVRLRAERAGVVPVMYQAGDGST